MKRFLKIVGILLTVVIVGIVVTALLVPWMDRWGAYQQEISGSLPGDELVLSPNIGYTRAITINASPEQIYPWIVQIGAGKAGWYSYDWFETNVLRCQNTNADRIHEEWQDLKVGGQVKMCPDENMPPAYKVARMDPDQAIVLGHQDADRWVEVWQFVMVPQGDGSTRLVIRSRSEMGGWFWNVMRPGEFIMMRGMMQGIKERAERMAAG
ncbi:MAG: SRPBCC family protein [Bacteroidota bacterium]